MENVLPKYTRPIKNTDEPTVNVDFWNEATDAFDEKEFRKSTIAVVNYMNPNFEILKLQVKERTQEIVFIRIKCPKSKK